MLFLSPLKVTEKAHSTVVAPFGMHESTWSLERPSIANARPFQRAWCWFRRCWHRGRNHGDITHRYCQPTASHGRSHRSNSRRSTRRHQLRKPPGGVVPNGRGGGATGPTTQWLFLVPLKGGRWHIIPRKAIYKWYI